jgi:hypothetical protein
MVKQDGSARPCKLYVTRHKEYLVFQEACVGIRDRATGRWFPVLPNRVIGSMPVGDDEELAAICEAPPRVGERLCIQVQGRRILSSMVLSVERAAFPRTK